PTLKPILKKDKPNADNELAKHREAKSAGSTENRTPRIQTIPRAHGIAVEQKAHGKRPHCGVGDSEMSEQLAPKKFRNDSHLTD
ncbi:hypothetical protein PMAYCL1PPCAC_13081, partial [Pristionchus mayeri]